MRKSHTLISRQAARHVVRRLGRQPASRQRQRGASLLEGIAYLGIAALVVLGAVSLLSSAFGSARSNQTSAETVALRTAARKLYTGQVYDANIVTNLINARGIPNTLVTNLTANTIANSWGGAVTITAAATGTNFVITYTNVPRDVCMSVVSGANGWVRIARDAAGAGAINTNNASATAADATTLCNADPVTVAFTST